MQSNAIKLSKKYKKFIYNDLFVNPNGIYGVKHSIRVLIHALTLAEINDLPKKDYNILAFASLYHDIGRQHNNECKRHGYMSVRKLNKLKEEGNYNLMELDERSTFIAEKIIQLHPLSHGLSNSIINRIDDEKIRIELDFLLTLFKDANALDRVRVDDLDTSVLQLNEACDLVCHAYDLLVQIS